MSDDRLLSFVNAVSGDDFLKVEESFGGGFVRLRVAEAERRQARHDIRFTEDIVLEMLRNSRDAGARVIFVATTRHDNMRSLVFVDDGEGIPEDMHDKVFEARVTSKLESVHMDSWGIHGRGMALYSIRENARTARVAASEPGKGSAFVVEVDLDTLSERSDQSTYPLLVTDEEGRRRIANGPHNIIRTVLEFALEHPDLDVYLGSPSEVCATMLQLGRDHLARLHPSFSQLVSEDLDEVPLYARTALAGDAAELAEQASRLGIELSERTARRVLDKTVHALSPALSKVTPASPSLSDAKIKADPYKDNRGLKLSREDVKAFQSALEQAFMPLGERYYLSLAGRPSVRVQGSAIHVRFDIEHDDD